MSIRAMVLAACLIGAAAGCQTRHEVTVQPVEVKPIHITIDVNVKVDRALDDFFGDVYGAAENGTPARTNGTGN